MVSHSCHVGGHIVGGPALELAFPWHVALSLERAEQRPPDVGRAPWLQAQNVPDAHWAPLPPQVNPTRRRDPSSIA